ncbi:HAAS signaling domain-containing protein [Cellulomonas sp. McL0617]|uniref:HAAS signaling domain-containing protein n=1 Tax=Cellulomonas sp. McL0617 TaxID=3415675 RepID=UPI003CE8A236
MSVLETTDVMDVAAYAAAVRAALDGLAPEQVEDLTDDLEADLADALADERHNAHGRGVLEQFGPPQEYAAELRAAAGLAPVAVEAARRTTREVLGTPVRAVRRGGRTLLGALREKPFWPPVESFLVALRPFWWILRGWVGYQVLCYLAGATTMRWLPRSLVQWVVLAVAVVLSVQWGRGMWNRSRSFSWVAGAANVAAVVLVLPVFVTVQGQVHRWETVYDNYARGAFSPSVQTQVVYKDKAVDGVVVDGIQVSNLFAYDAAGNPLTDVQIFDDRGRPVRTTFDNGAGQFFFPETKEPWSFVSRTDADGRSRWNVYPLKGAPTSQFTFADDGTHALTGSATASIPPRPFAKAPALDASAESSVAADAVAPTPVPTP